MSNPNNCETCKYHPDPDAEGHCYMFRDAPTDVCMQHSGREKPLTPEFISLMSAIVNA
jgi:hypothetical protein